MKTEVKERQIILNANAVRALLEGRKVQHRMAANLANVLSAEQKRLGFEQCPDPSKFRATTLVKGLPRLTVPTRHPDDARIPWDDCGGGCLYCPFETGSRVWVKETWMPVDLSFRTPAHFAWKVDRPGSRVAVAYRADADYHADWCSCTTMPRWASRLAFEITDIRVQRCQSVLVSEARKEGIVQRKHPTQFSKDGVIGHDGCAYMSVGHAWAAYCEATFGKGSWEQDVWLWALTFKVV